MAFGVKTNEGARSLDDHTGTRAQARYVRVSASKAREVLDKIRGLDVKAADEMLQFLERDVAIVVRKLLASAVANAEHNDSLAAEELFVSACFADEGPTLKRFRPRARGRASRIRKRTCHITILVKRFSDEELERRQRAEESRPASTRARRTAASQASSRAQRVAKSRKAAAKAASREEEEHDHEHEGHDHEGHDHDHEGHDHDHDEETDEALDVAESDETPEAEAAEEPASKDIVAEDTPETVDSEEEAADSEEGDK
jgi:large subunit ribosomal protein L22